VFCLNRDRAAYSWSEIARTQPAPFAFQQQRRLGVCVSSPEIRNYLIPLAI